MESMAVQDLWILVRVAAAMLLGGVLAVFRRLEDRMAK